LDGGDGMAHTYRERLNGYKRGREGADYSRLNWLGEVVDERGRRSGRGEREQEAPE